MSEQGYQRIAPERGAGSLEASVQEAYERARQERKQSEGPSRIVGIRVRVDLEVTR